MIPINYVPGHPNPLVVPGQGNPIPGPPNNMGYVAPQNPGMQPGLNTETPCNNPKHYDEPRFVCLDRNCYRFLCVQCLRDHPREHGDPILARDVTDQHLRIEDFHREKVLALEKIKKIFDTKDEKVKMQESVIQGTINEMRVGLNEYAWRFQEEAKLVNLDNNQQTKEAFLILKNHHDELNRFSFQAENSNRKIEKIQDFIKAKSMLQQSYSQAKEKIANYQIDEPKVKAYRDKFGEIIQTIKPADLLVSSEQKDFTSQEKLRFLEGQLLVSQQESQRLRAERNHWRQAVDEVIDKVRHQATIMACGLVAPGSNLPGKKDLYYCIGKNKGCQAFSIYTRDKIIQGTNPSSTNTNMCLAALHSGVIHEFGGFFHKTEQQGIQAFSGSNKNGIISFGVQLAHPASGFLLS